MRRIAFLGCLTGRSPSPLCSCICGSKSTFNPATGACVLDDKGVTLAPLAANAFPINATTNERVENSTARVICVKTCESTPIICADGSDYQSVEEAVDEKGPAAYSSCGLYEGGKKGAPRSRRAADRTPSG